MATSADAPSARPPLRILLVGTGHAVTRGLARGLAAAAWAQPVIGSPLEPPPSADPVAVRSLDWRDAAAWRRVLADVDAVIHAGFGDAARMAAVTDALASAASDVARGLRIVHLGSMTVYGSAVGLIDETASLRGDLGPYCAAHVAADHAVARLPNAVRLRLGVEYGPGCLDWTARPARWLAARRIGDLGAAGDGWCNLAYVDDIVEAALLCAAGVDVGGEAFNLAGADPPTWNEYLLRFGKALGTVPVARISDRYLRLETRLFAPPLKLAELALRRLHADSMRLPPAIPPAFLATARQRIRLDTQKARSRLGLVPTDVEVGIERAATWCRAR